MKYIAFLRGINVSGQKKMKMADLRHSLEKEGFQNVSTYIQSGNVVLESGEQNVAIIKKKLEDIIERDFGFQVPTLLKTLNELNEILKENPFGNIGEKKNLYFALLYDKPKEELIEKFMQLQFKTEDFHYSECCVYLNCKMGAGKAKLSNNLIENKLKVTATTRNLNTMLKMIALADS